MASSNEAISDMLDNQRDLKDAISENGQNITRYRPAYTDLKDRFHKASTVAFQGVVGVTKRKIMQELQLIGGDNIANPNADDLLCAWDVDIREGDILTFNFYQWNVAKANPAIFTSQDILVYWEFTLDRLMSVRED